jgi:hypothetical protein
VESVATMRTIIDAAECWMERNPAMMEKRIMRNIERVRACRRSFDLGVFG